MKTRIIIWTVVGLLVAGFLLIWMTTDTFKVPQPVLDPQEFVGRMEGRLERFEQRYLVVDTLAPQGGAAESCRAEIDRRLVATRQLLDSLRRADDIEVGQRLRARVQDTYMSAKDWRQKLANLAGFNAAPGDTD